MPELDGVEATRRITRLVPSVQVVALSGCWDPELVDRAREAGAAACVTKATGLDSLIDVIRDVRRSKQGPPSRAVPAGCDLTPLSPREQQVLRSMVGGATSKQIAYELQLSPRTVDTYRERIRDKLGRSSIAELTTYAIRTGLVDSE